MKTRTVRLTDAENQIIEDFILFRHFKSASAVIRKALVLLLETEKLKPGVKEKLNSERHQHPARRRRG